MASALDPRLIDSRVRAEMRRLVRRIEGRHLHARSTWAWLGFAAVALATAGGAWSMAWPASALGASIALEFLGCAWLVARWWRAPVTDYRAAAEAIERSYPELGHALHTAIEQQPDAAGRYSFLQTRLLKEVLDHAYRHFWSRSRIPAAKRAMLAHGTALSFACALAAFLINYRPPDRPPGPPTHEELAAGLEITPGDTEVERGTTVIITARFGEGVPAEATLRWRTADGTEHQAAMARSLADPVFAATLPNVATTFDYAVAFGSGTSDEYRISVFDLPRMLRGDASLTYPDFTGLAPKRIEDTRRISAVEGSRLDYSIQANKPLREAYLLAADGSRVPLEATNDARTRYALSMPVAQSGRFTIHLSDDAGRANPDPPELRIEALPNHRPELKLAFPRGDQRVSPLEEVALEGSAADDFGLLDYGLAWSVAGAEPVYVSSRADNPPSGAPARPLEAGFQQLLALESLGVEPAQLISWFAWADDVGSDGEPRRTRGDLFFAEVRPFDEVFRESEGGSQAQQGNSGAGDPAAELLELQRDISLAIWKLRNEPAHTDAFHEDISTILESQQTARRLLARSTTELRDALSRSAAVEAERHMDSTADRLDESREESSIGPLAQAWTSSQSAYQALLRMQPDESQVGRERANAGGRRDGRGNRRQLDQLRFKDDADRYEMESEARLSSTPEQRAEMQTLARLRELARRQSELNERLQELQTALAAAEDENERDEIRRELKRLEEEQRRMMADLDDVRQRMDQQAPGARGAEVREQIERTREDMREAGESLQEGAVTRALASGTRAEENLEQARENLRERSASEFSEEMREIRRAARDLAEAQKRSEQILTDSEQRTAPSLDNANERGDLARTLDENREGLDQLMRDLRRVTEDAEEPEPALHRQLYDLLRDHAQGGGTQDQMGAAAELLRRGFTEQASELQPKITESLEQLARGIERAAESVLGDDEDAMRFAQAELDQLARSLKGSEGDERPDDSGRRGEAGNASAGARPGATDAREQPADDALSRTLAELGRAARGAVQSGRDNPLTGDGYAEWEERLRTVEALLDEPSARERLARARERGAELRREYRRHGSPPLSTTVESGIIAPLSEVRAWLRQELARREDPASLQPVDRDPVPEAYAEAVRRYYEALGE